MAGVTDQTLDANGEIVSDVVEAARVQFERSHRADIAGPRGWGLVAAEQRAVQCHRLRGVLDTVHGGELLARAQRVGRIAVRPRAAVDRICVPADHLVQQAHAAGVRDARGDRRVVERPSVTQYIPRSPAAGVV